MGCQPENESTVSQHNVGPLFELKDNERTGIDFSNDLTYTSEFNVYKYRNFYNGGGVAIGDVNNDGLVDIYLTANQTSNKLYLNKGDWKFEDVTERAGVGGERAWSTGVTMVDVNGDGLLDIYVCNSGDVEGDNKENELFINQGGLRFEEQAAQYNLNDKGYSTHASFFDYDKDGDLDVYILNNSFQAIGSFNLRKNERPKRDELGGDKLMRNEGGRFEDVSEKAGIYGSVIGFGLGVTVGDVNNDNWEDIFISNDFFERDYLYINQQNGTFKEDLVNQINSISGASMGADMADINNDGYQDIFVTEMLPSDYTRLKSVTTFEGWDKYNYNVANGYHHQFTRNVLHLNRGNNTFSEVSRLAGVEASDWSWGALFFDMDNDGFEDLFIANGIYKDLTDQDYLQYIANESVIQSIISDKGVDYKELIDIIPSNKVPNHAFRNLGGLAFKAYPESGLQAPSFSNGSAYGDLDNDGDLDLIVNNVSMPCFVYENKNATGNFMKFNLRGEAPNTFAIGSKVKIQAGDKSWLVENQPTRGFQSSVDPAVIVGVGEVEAAEVSIIWPNGKVTALGTIDANQSLTVSASTGQVVSGSPDQKGQQNTFEAVAGLLDYQHKENNYVDFNRERLLYHGHSTEGPRIDYGDLNKDGFTDIVIPGPKGAVSVIGFGNADGGFTIKPLGAVDKGAEHLAAHLFDADGDGDDDLYLTSGGV
ncbi:MAG: CRTAC1 family protein, partial [Phaeodactylibacter sp.]|nr:CRTAC1 family protein [Phaeodactylibacter sp.]